MTAADEAAEAVALAERRWAKAEEDRVKSLLNIGTAKKEWEESNVLLSKRMAEEVELAKANQKAANLAMEEAETKMRAHEMINSARLAATLSGAPQLFPTDIDLERGNEDGRTGEEANKEAKREADSNQDHIEAVRSEIDPVNGEMDPLSDQNGASPVPPPLSLSKPPRRGGWSKAKGKINLFPAGLPGLKESREEPMTEDEAQMEDPSSTDEEASDSSQPHDDESEGMPVDSRKLPLFGSGRGQWTKMKQKMNQPEQETTPMETATTTAGDPTRVDPKSVASKAGIESKASRWKAIAADRQNRTKDASVKVSHWKKVAAEKQQAKEKAHSMSNHWKQVSRDRTAAADTAREAAMAATTKEEALRFNAEAKAAEEDALEAAEEEAKSVHVSQKATANADAASSLLLDAQEEEAEIKEEEEKEAAEIEAKVPAEADAAKEGEGDSEDGCVSADPVLPSQGLKGPSRWKNVKSHAKSLLPRDPEAVRSLPGKEVRQAAKDLETKSKVSNPPQEVKASDQIEPDAYGLKVAKADVAVLQVAQLVAAAKKGETSDIEAAEQIARIYGAKTGVSHVSSRRSAVVSKRSLSSVSYKHRGEVSIPFEEIQADLGSPHV